MKATRRPGCPGCDAGLRITTFASIRRETVGKFWECHDWFRPCSFVFPDYIFRVNHHRRVIYWHCWYFRSTQPPHHHHHHHLVYPLLCLIPSINASRQALGYHSSSTLLSCTLMSLHPSSSFSIKGSCMGSSYLFLWICKPLLSICQAIGKMLYGGSMTCIEIVLGIWKVS